MADEVMGFSGLDADLATGDLFRASEHNVAAAEEYRRTLDTTPDLPVEQRSRLRWHLAWCLHEQGLNREALAELHRLDRDVESLSILWQARVHALIGWTWFFLGDCNKCIGCCDRARKLLAPTAHHGDFARILRWLGYAWRETGDTTRATKLMRDALSAARRADDSEQAAKILSALGALSFQQGKPEEARSYCEEALGLDEQRGELKAATRNRMYLGLMCLYEGRLESAAELLDTCLGVYRQLGAQKAVVNTQIAMARLARRMGDSEQARAHAEAALSGAQSLAFDRGVALANEEIGDLNLDAGDIERATLHYRQGLSVASRIAPDGDLAYELSWRLGQALGRMGDHDEAVRLVERAYVLSDRHGDLREVGNCLLVRAGLEARMRHWDEAGALLRRAQEHFGRIGMPFELASAHTALADVLAADPVRSGEARAHLHDARRILRQMGLSKAAEDIDRRLGELEGRTGVGACLEESDAHPAFARIVAQDRTMLETVGVATRLAELDVSILLEGETGTGKELFARAIHEASPRVEEPFVAVNCAAVPKELLEGELFGHAKGAFTGAFRGRRGYLTRAGRGTVFLDEIDKSTRDFQARLLRVLEDREVWPVGADQCEPLEATILCATNAPARDLREGGGFLPDLYYRLAEFTLRIPPLREREGDVLLLTEKLLQELGGRLRTVPSGLTDAARGALVRHSWPGNVRELRNALVTAVLNAGDGNAIDVRHLPVEVLLNEAGANATGQLNERIERIEREAIISALNAAGGVKATAARMLGVSRKGLRDRLRRLGLD